MTGPALTRTDYWTACGQSPTVGRLPFGDGHNADRVLSAMHLPSIYWSVDTNDWRNTDNPQETINKALSCAKDGAIILLHDKHAASVTAAECIIPALINRGFQLVTVNEMARYKGAAPLQLGRTYYSF